MSKIHEALEKAEQQRRKRLEQEISPIHPVFPTGESMPPTLESFSVSSKTDMGQHQQSLKQNIACLNDVDTLIAEQFRSLRTNLKYAQNGKLQHCIGISSPGEGEGKTTVAVNLAVTIVMEPENRVLLIDADLRNPNAHLKLGLPLQPGWTEVLRKLIPAEEAIQSTLIPNLFFLPAGGSVSNSADLLSSSQVKEFLQHVNSKFNFVILDTAPVLPVTDTLVLASHLDGILLVVQAKRTQQTAIDRTLERFDKTKGRVIGMILNKERRALREYNYYYSKYYNK